MSDTEIQTVATRSAPRTRANSRNNLSDVPIATPLLGETHGQISNLKNLRTKIEIGDTADIVDILKSRLSEKSQEVAAQQVNLVREINKIDQKLAKIDSRVEEKAKISINLSKEVAKFEAAEQVASYGFFWNLQFCVSGFSKIIRFAQITGLATQSNKYVITCWKATWKTRFWLKFFTFLQQALIFTPFRLWASFSWHIQTNPDFLPVGNVTAH